MKYIFLILLLGVTFLNSSFSQPMHGTGWVQRDFTYNIHKPWNVNINERYSYNPSTNEHRFWIYKDDEPFKQNDTTSPRCEMRINNNYTSGNHQFEADFYAVEGSDRPCVMQVWLGFMLKISGTEEGGSYWWHQSKELKKNIYGKWVRVNIVHITSEGKIYIYMDNEFITSVNANINSDVVYFKCGVYTTRSDKSEVWIRNIKYYVQSEISNVDLVKEEKIFFRLLNGYLNIDAPCEVYTKIHKLCGKLYAEGFQQSFYLHSKGDFIVRTEMDDQQYGKHIYTRKIGYY